MNLSSWKKFLKENIEGKYYLQELLGYGGFGGVYLADEVIDDNVTRQLAVKLIQADDDPETRKKQLEELRHAVNLKHPNLVVSFAPGLCQIKGDRFFYLLMELADETLHKRLIKGPLSVPQVQEIVLAIASALVYLHKEPARRVHRDLKPANILRVGNSWEIADFGLMRIIGNEGFHRTVELKGTREYVPPEAYQTKDITTDWDIWSLGVMIAEMLTGELPFTGETAALLMNQVINDPPSIEWSKVPPPFAEIIKGCLEKDKDKRWTAKRVFDQVAKFPPKIISSILITNLAASPLRDSSVYYDFFSLCPACLARSIYLNPAAWFCSICGAKIQIGNDAYLKCLNGHSCHTSHARYACDNHPSEYEPITSANFAKAIAMSGQVADVAGISWFCELIANLGDDW